MRDAIVSALVRDQAVVVVTHSLAELDRDAAQRLLMDAGEVRKI